MTYKILIVEDDPVIAGIVAREIGRWGLEAKIAADLSNVLAEFASYAPQLVLLDISLPFYNGYHWCQEIRRVSSVPIIFLSSSADSLNMIMAMNLGADDFIAKPFDLTLLMAKIQALLRRAYDFGGQASLLEHRGAILNLGDATLTCGTRQVELTKNEFRILQLLMERKGHVVSREDIMARLWAGDSFIDENTLTVNINRLRRKLESAGLPDFIATKKGVGYLVG